jgi:hypothetical protein
MSRTTGSPLATAGGIVTDPEKAAYRGVDA